MEVLPPSQGYESIRTVPECTWVPKPVISQALTGFPSPTTIQVPDSLLPSLYLPREWNFTLLCHAVPQVVLLLFSGPPAQLVHNLNVGTLRTHSCEKKQGTCQCISDMQGPGHGWIAPVTITANYPMANSSVVQFPFPSQDMNEDGSMNG
jgi:hypothetical protein